MSKDFAASKRAPAARIAMSTMQLPTGALRHE
jgi:hypothetical protein